MNTVQHLVAVAAEAAETHETRLLAAQQLYVILQSGLSLEDCAATVLHQLCDAPPHGQTPLQDAQAYLLALKNVLNTTLCELALLVAFEAKEGKRD